jgi:hypothetical protein
MNDAPHFIYHVRYLAAATTPDNEAAADAAMARGREMSAEEAAVFALTNVAAD